MYILVLRLILLANAQSDTYTDENGTKYYYDDQAEDWYYTDSNGDRQYFNIK